jgi:hypothetical protein
VERTSEWRYGELVDGAQRGVFIMLLSLASLVWPEWGWNPDTNLAVAERRVITPEEFRSGRVQIGDPELIVYLDRHPEALKSLQPRDFEEFVADLLRRSGHETKVGRKGRDGGIDVTAWRQGEFGPEMTLVQCKRYTDKKVSEPVVKQLYADVARTHATCGLVVTTSHFSSEALKLIEEIKYQMAGRDFEDLQEWMKKVLAL